MVQSARFPRTERWTRPDSHRPQIPPQHCSRNPRGSCFDVTRLVWTGSRIDLSPLERLPREERMKGYKDVAWTHDEVDKPFKFFKSDVTPVCVELLENSEPLTTFQHPDNAVYVFGPEDGGVPQVLPSLPPVRSYSIQSLSEPRRRRQRRIA